jgi:hypothetical protein
MIWRYVPFWLQIVPLPSSWIAILKVDYFFGGWFQECFLISFFLYEFMQHGCDTSALNSSAIFIPVVPLFEKTDGEESGSEATPLSLGMEERGAIEIRVEPIREEGRKEGEKEGGDDEKKEGKIKRKISFSLFPGKGEKESGKKEEKKDEKHLQVQKGKRGLKNLVPFYRQKKGGEESSGEGRGEKEGGMKLASPRGLLVAAFGAEKKEEKKEEKRNEMEAAHEVLLKSFSDAVSHLVPFDYLPIFLAEQNRTIEVFSNRIS